MTQAVSEPMDIGLGDKPSPQAYRLFAGCFAAMFATSFAFIVRALVITDWGTAFGLSEAQKGAIFPGAALFPFAISIVLFSLFIDRIGYGRIMVFAFIGHVVGTGLTIFAIKAPSHLAAYQMLYFGTFITSLANGAIEAVVNPVTATLFPRNKTHYFNILHAGWPGGLVLAGVLGIILGAAHLSWVWTIALVFIPTIIYGVMLVGQRFPLQERVAAGVSHADMMREFGAAGAFIIAWFLTMAFLTVASVFISEQTAASHNWIVLNDWLPPAVALLTAIAFFAAYRAIGRPMFIFLMGIMILQATTELGTNGWITDLLTPVFKAYAGWILVYTSVIMFVFRFFAGPIVHKLNPLGLLCTCSAIAIVGLVWLGSAGTNPWMIFLAATVFGIGTAFFWPTTLGVVSEQFPKGGALTLSAMGGMGMIAVGVLGGPVLGSVMDMRVDHHLAEQMPAIHSVVAGEKQSNYFMKYQNLDQSKLNLLSKDDQAAVNTLRGHIKQDTLRLVAILPVVMLICYIGLVLYFMSRGGYTVEKLEMSGEMASGGIEGPVR
jgi:MFS family permease